ncbi:MAG: YezD family protein [Nitrospirae bacterium]|nr:YezD family protein [Nitrospirota bacterium]
MSHRAAAAQQDVPIQPVPSGSRVFKLILDLPWEQIERAARNLDFGSVVLTFHQGHVTQIERHERTRLSQE